MSPVLNIRLAGKARAADGKEHQLPPSLGIHQVGPRLPVVLHARSGKDATEPPGSKQGHALIDTGASATCVDIEEAGKIGLAIVGSGKMLTATAQVSVPIYAGMLSFSFVDFPNVNFTEAYGANLKSQGLIALIGRDLLSRCVLIVNGPDGTVSLSL